MTAASTTGYPSTGTLVVDDEWITYTGTTATTFTGLTRGAYGPTAAEPLFVLGNGTAWNALSNAVMIFNNGKSLFNGGATVVVPASLI